MIISNEMYNVHHQSVREIFVKISLLQNHFRQEGDVSARRLKKVGEITGSAIGGSINIDAQSHIRRTCQLSIQITDKKFLISEDSFIWIDKYFRLEIGIKSLISGEIIWFNQGIFAIDNPNIKYNSTSKQIDIRGIDLMATIDGTIGGNLGTPTIIPSETNISDAIRTTVNRLGKISLSDIYIEENPEPMPYDVEVSAEGSIYDLLNEIKEMYMDWEMFFDVNGRFIYRKIKNRHLHNEEFRSDNIIYDFKGDDNLIVDYSVDYDFSNVKNKINIIGKLRDDGIQIREEIVNTDSNSPFNIYKPIGVIQHTVVDEKIVNKEQAIQKARYEYWKRNNFNERLTIISVPIYFLDVNRLVDVKELIIDINGRYLIDNISIPLNHDGVMNISAHKSYQPDVDID